MLACDPAHTSGTDPAPDGAAAHRAGQVGRQDRPPASRAWPRRAASRQRQAADTAGQSAVPELKPRDGAPAAPSPSPPRCKAGNEVEPPAVFRFTTGRARLRHSWPAQVGDLDADDVVRCFDCDRDRLAGGARAAVPDAVGEKLAHEQRGHVPARVTGA